MWDLLSWTGGRDPAGQPARRRALLCRAVLGHAACTDRFCPVLCTPVRLWELWGSAGDPGLALAMQEELGRERGPVAGVCPVVAPVERGHVGLRSVGGRSWELLPWEHWMCLQQVCLEEAGLVLTGPWQPHQQRAPRAGTALQGPGPPCPSTAVPTTGGTTPPRGYRPLTGGCPRASASSSLHHCGRAGLVLGPAEPPRMGEMLPHLEAPGVCGAVGGESHGVSPHSTNAPQLLDPSH